MQLRTGTAPLCQQRRAELIGELRPAAAWFISPESEVIRAIMLVNNPHLLCPPPLPHSPQAQRGRRLLLCRVASRRRRRGRVVEEWAVGALAAAAIRKEASQQQYRATVSVLSQL